MRHKWLQITDRCYREKCKSYKNYGGRGIEVCNEWRSDYKAFYDWSMANGYKEEQTAGGVNILSIDRINNDGNYEPSNCRWVTPKQNSNNTRFNRLLTLNGETHTMSEWSDITGISQTTLSYRIHRLGWNDEQVLTTPINKSKSRNNKKPNQAIK